MKTDKQIKFEKTLLTNVCMVEAGRLKASVAVENILASLPELESTYMVSAYCENCGGKVKVEKIENPVVIFPKPEDVSKEELKMSKDIKNISFSTSIEGGYDDKGNLTGNRIKVLWMHFKGENKESMLNLNNLISESSITIDEAMKEAIMSNFKKETSKDVSKPELEK